MAGSIDSVGSIGVDGGWFTLVDSYDIEELEKEGDLFEVYSIQLPDGSWKSYLFESPTTCIGSPCTFDQNEELKRKAPSLWESFL